MEEDIKIIESVIYNDEGKKMSYVDVDYAEGEEFINAVIHLIEINRELKEIEQVHKEQNGELQKQLSENEADMTSAYLKGVYDERDKWKARVKAKIKEKTEALEKVEQMSASATRYDTIQKLDNEINTLEELLQE